MAIHRVFIVENFPSFYRRTILSLNQQTIQRVLSEPLLYFHKCLQTSFVNKTHFWELFQTDDFIDEKFGRIYLVILLYHVQSANIVILISMQPQQPWPIWYNRNEIELFLGFCRIVRRMICISSRVRTWDT